MFLWSFYEVDHFDTSCSIARHITKGEFGEHGTWSKARAWKISKRIFKEEHSASGMFENCLGLFLFSRRIQSNWILEWQPYWPPLSDLIESPHFFHDFLFIILLMNGQTRGICPLSPTYQLSLIFQTLPIYPGLLSEKVLTFKRIILGNGTHPCFQSALQLSGLCVPPAFLTCMPCQLKCTWVESGRFLIVVLLILKAQREPHLFWASQNSLYNQFLWLFKQSQ